MAVIGALSVKLGLVTVEWDQATAKAKQQAKDLQKAINNLTGDFKSLGGILQSLGGATGLGGLGFAALTQQTLEFANATQDLAKGFEISVAKVLQFKDAIKTSGGNAEGASKMLSTLFTKIEEAQSGNEAAISQFERLGITFEELKNLKPEDAINRIFNALNEQSLSTYQRVKLVKEMLGKQGIGLAIDEVAAKLNMSVEAYRKNEAAIKKLGDVSDNLKTSMDNLKLAFADVISPFTTGDGLVKVESFKAALYAIGSVYLIGQLMKVYEVFMLIRAALAANAAITASLTAMGGYKGLALAAVGFTTYKGAQALFGDESSNTVSREATGKLEDARPEEEKSADLDANRKDLTALQAKISLQNQLAAIERQQGELKIDALTKDKHAIDLRTIELALETQLATIANARAQALSKENLSEAQRALIEKEYNAEANKARSKSAQEKALLNAQNEIAVKQLQQQTTTLKENLSIQSKELLLKLNLIGADEKVAALAQLDMEIANERLQKENQFASDKTKSGQTAAERNATALRHSMEISALEEKQRLKAEIINKTYQDRLDLMQRGIAFQNSMQNLDISAMTLEVDRNKMRNADLRLAQEDIQLKQKVLELNKQLTDARINMGKGEAYNLEEKRIQAEIIAQQTLSMGRKQIIRDEDTQNKKVQKAQLLALAEELQLQQQASTLKLNNIGIDEKIAALEEVRMSAAHERSRLENQYTQDKLRSLQTEEDLANLQNKHALELRSINDKEKIDSQIISKNYEKKLNLMKQANIFQNNSLALNSEAMILELIQYTMADDAIKLAQEKIQHKRNLLELEKQLANAAQMGKGEAYDAEINSIQNLIANENLLHEARIQNIRNEEERRTMFSSGFHAAARQFAADAENYGKLGADMFGAAIGNMNSAIDNFVRTGKFNFKDFAKSIIQDIMAMILKFQAMQIVMMGMRAMGFGGFGGGNAVPLPDMSGVAVAAAGGEIDGPTIVGENGPELFIPQRRGTVIPNMQASSYMGGQPSVVYNGPYIQNMNAIDTQSATQFLSKNKSAVWSANQSAQRSLPVSK